MSSSTSSSKPALAPLRRALAAVFVGGSAVLFLLLAALDPWGALPVNAGRCASPPITASAGRILSWRGIRSFDAAIIGTSPRG